MSAIARMHLARRGVPALLVLLAALTGCGRAVRPAVTVRWVVGASEPRFDPDGPPLATRWALERWLSRGLTGLDGEGRVEADAAARWEVTPDGRTWTFHLRDSLAFTDGTPCTSADFARALAAGLGRTDHGTRSWLLAAVRGVERVRAGKPTPALGIETPGPRTLVIRLERPDPLLPARLALPGVSTPWRARAPARGWGAAVGLGPYRVLAHQPGRALTLVRAGGGGEGPDTLAVRFAIGAGRVRAMLRLGRADIVWPLPPALLDESLPAGTRSVQAEARPERTLVLALRADTPPTHRLPARAALAHGLNRVVALRALGAVGRGVQEWPVGAGHFEFPAFDAGEVARWMERGRLGRSFHVALGYDADGVGAGVAPRLQGEWSRLGIYVELQPLRGPAALDRALSGGPQLFLAESQPLLDRDEAALAALVMPLRGPAVGNLRTGWRTREFDPWIWPGARAPAAPLDGPAARQRLEQECVALPLAGLPWVWVVREAAVLPLILHPRFGPACIPHAAEGPTAVGR